MNTQIYDIIIIGGGACGAAAALEASQQKIECLMLDVGYTAANTIESPSNLYSMKETKTTTDFLIGNNFEYFNTDRELLPAKLKSPYFDFVTKGSGFFDIEQSNYNAITSYAKGGLANAWGNGLMRFAESEFNILPICLNDLISYYEKLEKEIGVSGSNDDLAQFFGQLDWLQQPLKRSAKAEKIYARYKKKKAYINSEEIYLGAPRLGVSQNCFDIRDGCKYDNLEFWQPEHRSLYSPVMTIDKLIKSGSINYIGKVFADTWEESSGIVTVHAYDVVTKTERTFKAKKLILAGGTLNTSRIVLKSRQDYKAELTFMDNPAVQLPVFFPSEIGGRLEREAFGLSQLSMVYKSKVLGENVIGAILELTSPLRSEFLDKFPFSFRENIKFIKYFLPAMMAVQIFLPSDLKLSAKLSLKANGAILMRGSRCKLDSNIITEAVKKLRNLGMYTLKSFAVEVSNGNGIHYCGTLPMRANPATPYETDRYGLLADTKGVFVADGACFGSIPATNYSLSIMANSMRVTGKAIEGL